MRYRRVRNPQRAIERAQAKAPRQAARLSPDVLIDAGVRKENLGELQRLIADHSLVLAAEVLRTLLLSLEKSPAAVALRRAVLGDDGVPLSAEASDCGTSKQSLSRSVLRLKKRLDQITG